MDLKPHDLSFVFDDDANRLQCFDAAGQMRWKAEARNSAVNRGTVGHHGAAPRGLYLLGTPRRKNDPAFGKWFVPLHDFGDHHAARDHARVGLGVHGGGTGLPDPFAPEQGWAKHTLGCVRLQNSALSDFVALLRRCQTAGGTAYFTVKGAPGAENLLKKEKVTGEEEVKEKVAESISATSLPNLGPGPSRRMP